MKEARVLIPESAWYHLQRRFTAIRTDLTVRARVDDRAFTAVRPCYELHLVGQTRHFVKPSQNVTVELVVILFRITTRFVACECLVACQTHALAKKLVHRPVLFCTVFGAVGFCCAAPTVSKLVSGGGGRPTLRAHEPRCGALLFDGGGGDLDTLVVNGLIKRVAEVLAHGVHACSTSVRCYKDLCVCFL